MNSDALPLKVTPATPTRANSDKEEILDKTPTSLARRPSTSASNGNLDISSPHELTAFVEKLLEQLETKFDDISTQILDRMTQMSSRVDSLEAAIQDIINGDSVGTPPVSLGSVPESPASFPLSFSQRNGGGS